MIQGEYLDNFLTCLKTHAEISGGFCKLDSKNVNMDNEFFPKSEMYEHAYRGMHPSGMFFRKDAVSIERDKTKCFEENSVYYANPFIHDLLLARSYSLGIGMYYKNRLVTVETQEDTKKIQSFSFTKENQNLFFMPGNRINQMNVNFMHLNTLNLPYEVFDKVVSAICFRTVKQVAYEYRFLLSDETVCRHYRLEMRYINKPELEENAKRVCDEILKTPYLKYSMEKRKELAEQSYFYGFELV